MDLSETEKPIETSDELSQASGHGQIRHKFTIDKIMSYFTKQKLTYLQAMFRKHCRDTEEDGFALVEFVQLIKRVIPHKPDEVYDLIYGIYSLFREIDINGDGTMEWDEFVSYIIEAADAQTIDLGASIFQGNQSIAKVERVMQMEETIPTYLHSNNLLLKAMAQKLPVFGESKIFADTLGRNTAVQKALVYKRIDALVTMESNTRRLRVIQAMSNQAIPGIAQDSIGRTRVLQTIELHLPNEAYILGAAMNEQDGLLAVTSTEGLIYFYKYSTQIQRFRVFKIICCCHIDGCQHQIWYLPKFGSFFTAGSKNILREWKVKHKKRQFDPTAICEKCTNLFFPRRGSKAINQAIYENTTNYVERPFNATCLADSTSSYLLPTPDHHQYRDMIQDCIEMHFPYMAIITACHDGKISIISKELNRIVGVLETGHQTGIRQLDYTPYHGGALISVGYEQFFNVWEMESSASFGKRQKEIPKQLKMINYPVVAAKFLGNTFYVACVDQVNTVKIYNYKTQEVVQSLTRSLIRQQNVTGIMVFSEGRFVVLGKKMVYYDTLGDGGANSIQPSRIYSRKQVEIRKMILNERGMSEMEQASAYQQVSLIQPPIDALFVESYQTVLVLSKTNLRIYSTRNGRLIKIIENLGGDQSNYGELTSMCLDHPHRKLFIGDSRGVVRIFNVNSGVLMSELEMSEEMQSKINESGPRINKELCALTFFNAQIDDDQNFMLITGQGSNRVSVWDVNDSEDADMIRTVSGGNVLREDILTIASSEHHSIIATGGIQGTICLWDFELFKLIGVLTGCRGAVCFLEFADQFPLLVACTQLGVICVFTVRGAPSEIRNICIARFVNLQPQVGSNIYINAQITSCMLRVYENPNFTPRTAEESSQSEYNDREPAKVKFFKTELDPEPEEQHFKTAYSDLIDEYVLTFPPDENKYNRLLQSVSAGLRNQMADQMNDSALQKIDNHFHSHLHKKFQPPGDSEKPYIMHIFFGDSDGNIKRLDLSTFVRDPLPSTLARYASSGLTIEKMAESDSPCAPFFKQARAYHETKIGFMASRRLFNGVGGLGVSMREQAFLLKQPTIIDASKCVLTKVIMNAHRQRINSIRAIRVEPFGFISTSLDKHVKLWTEEGELCGDINLVKEMTRLDEWKFAFDWDQQGIEQLDKVKEIHTEIQKIEAGSEEDDDTGSSNKRTKENEKSFDSEKSYGIKHQPYKLEFEKHPALKHLIQAQKATTYEAKSEQVRGLFYDGCKVPVKPQTDEDSDSELSLQTEETEEFKVDKLLPEEVWKSMIDVEEEKRLIKNLTSDYENFIKTGSIDAIKRNCVIQQSSDPKDKKLVQSMLQRIEQKKTEKLETKLQHRLSVRMGINLQRLNLGPVDQAAARRTPLAANDNLKPQKSIGTTETFQTVNLKENIDQYQSSANTASTNTDFKTERQNTPGNDIQVVDQAVIPPIDLQAVKADQLAGVPFTLKQYTEQSTRKIAGQKNTITVLRQSSEQVMNKVIQSKEKTDKNIQAFRGSVAQNNAPDIGRMSRVRSVPILKNQDAARKTVGFMKERPEDPQDREIQDLAEKCNAKFKQLQRILDTKHEIEQEKSGLQKMDPDFYNQLTERLSLKKIEEQHQKMLASATSQPTLPSLSSHQKYTENIIFESLKKEKFRFKRKAVVGLDSRNTNSKFLSKLDKFIDVSDRRFKVPTSMQPTAIDDQDATPRTLRKQAYSHRELPTYNGDMMTRPGETARRINQAFSQLNQQNYSQINPNTSAIGFVLNNGKSIVKQVVEWKSIQRNKKSSHLLADDSSSQMPTEVQTPGLERIDSRAISNFYAQHNGDLTPLEEDFRVPGARSSFIKKVASGQNFGALSRPSIKIAGLKDLH